MVALVVVSALNLILDAGFIPRRALGWGAAGAAAATTVAQFAGAAFTVLHLFVCVHVYCIMLC